MQTDNAGPTLVLTGITPKAKEPIEDCKYSPTSLPNLPAEIRLMILEYASSWEDQAAISKVCSFWREFIKTSKIARNNRYLPSILTFASGKNYSKLSIGIGDKAPLVHQILHPSNQLSSLDSEVFLTKPNLKDYEGRVEYIIPSQGPPLSVMRDDLLFVSEEKWEGFLVCFSGNPYYRGYSLGRILQLPLDITVGEFTDRVLRDPDMAFWRCSRAGPICHCYSTVENLHGRYTTIGALDLHLQTPQPPNLASLVAGDKNGKMRDPELQVTGMIRPSEFDEGFCIECADSCKSSLSCVTRIYTLTYCMAPSR